MSKVLEVINVEKYYGEKNWKSEYIDKYPRHKRQNDKLKNNKDPIYDPFYAGEEMIKEIISFFYRSLSATDESLIYKFSNAMHKYYDKHCLLVECAKAYIIRDVEN